MARRWPGMDMASILLVEGDILVRHPLAEYLRDCGYRVVEAASQHEAEAFLAGPDLRLDVIIADLSQAGGVSFAFVQAARAARPDLEVLLAGNVTGAAEQAARLCAEGGGLPRPYEHRLVEDRIRRALAERETRRREKEPEAFDSDPPGRLREAG